MAIYGNDDLLDKIVKILSCDALYGLTPYQLIPCFIINRNHLC